MRLLVVGAGASYAEAEQAGLPESLRPPFLGNFAAKMWGEYNPHFLLSDYLRAAGHEPGEDAREAFIRLERARAPAANIEQFFEFAYEHRDLKLLGHQLSEYENLLYHGMLRPLCDLLLFGLFKDGVEAAPLTLSKAVAKNLRAGDVVVNLNYDTIFEIGAERAGHILSFLPGQARTPGLAIAKPHGSFNLLVHKTRGEFYFARPYFVGAIQPADGASNYIGLVPPHLNKRYDQHPIARTIVHAMAGITPSHVIFWGVGLAKSDKNLLALYYDWCGSAERIDFINPSAPAADNARSLLNSQVHQFLTVDEWQAAVSAA